jgi:RimJ/RimL family protein N-acetyltransferase
MILEFSKIRLRQIDQGDIEMLRQWRNDQKIVQFMFFNQYITESMQQKWFSSLGESDFYFIIEYRTKALGLINLSDLQEKDNAAFAGLFIYEEAYWGTQIPVLASMRLLKFAFEERKLATVYAKVQKANIAAKKYNNNLGFDDCSEELQSINLENYTNVLKPLMNRISWLR